MIGVKQQFLIYGSEAPVFWVSIAPVSHLIWESLGDRCGPGIDYKVSGNISLELGHMRGDGCDLDTIFTVVYAIVLY